MQIAIFHANCCLIRCQGCCVVWSLWWIPYGAQHLLISCLHYYGAPSRPFTVYTFATGKLLAAAGETLAITGDTLPSSSTPPPPLVIPNNNHILLLPPPRQAPNSSHRNLLCHHAPLQTTTTTETTTHPFWNRIWNFLVERQKEWRLRRKTWKFGIKLAF